MTSPLRQPNIICGDTKSFGFSESLASSVPTALALASFECEPPDNNPEKERYKALK